MNFPRFALAVTAVSLASGCASAAPANPNLLPGDLEKLTPFSIRVDKGKSSTKGKAVAPWTANAYDPKTVGELRLGPDPKTQTASFGLVNLEGAPSMMLQMWRGVALEAPNRYQLSFDYLTAGKSGGVVKFPKSQIKEINLAPTDGSWKTLETAFNGDAARSFRLEVHNGGRGEENGLYLKNLRLEKIGAAIQTETVADPAKASATTAPDTANFERATGWYGQLAADLKKQGLPPGEFLIGGDEKSVTAQLRPYGEQIDRAEVRDLKADEIPADLPFKSGKQIEIVRATANPWGAVVGVKMDHPVKAGDAGLIVAYIRSGGSREANASSLWVEAKADGVKDLSDISGGRISPGPEWKLYQFPVNFKAASSDWKLELFAGGPTQVLQLGGVAFVYFGDKAKYADLPRTQYNYDYDGRQADAPWRAAAAARIEKYRKGDLRVVVTDANGRAIPDAHVEIAQTRQAFGFGTVLDTPFFAPKLDAKTRKQASDADLKRYRQTVLNNFNLVTIGTYKWEPWRGKWGPQFGPENTLKTLEWARKNDLRVHGHAPIWHEFGVMPFKEGQTPPAQIKGDIMTWLDTVLQSPGAREEIVSWDAINHPFAFSGVWRDYGKRLNLPDEGLELHLDELAKYRELVPDAKLFVNEANIMTRGGSQLQRFTDYIDYLTKHNAPLDGAAFMCHFDVNDLTPPDELYRRLEKLREAGAKNGRDLALRVTEFDVSVDPKDAKQVAVQADYTRDFYTLMFSHPQTDAIIAWGFWETAMWKPRAVWLTDDWKLRPNGQAVTDLLTKAWRTNAGGASDAYGVYATRGFKGDYKITVSQGGKTATTTAKIGDAAGEVRVVLK